MRDTVLMAALGAVLKTPVIATCGSGIKKL
jgi:hypothetical protein